MKGESDDKLGGKVFDNRSIKGGAVVNKRPGKHKFVVTLDLSSAYPSAKEACAIDSSTRVDNDIVNNPEKYNLEIVWRKEITDMYGPREIIGFRKINEQL